MKAFKLLLLFLVFSLNFIAADSHWLNRIFRMFKNSEKTPQIDSEKKSLIKIDRPKSFVIHKHKFEVYEKVVKALQSGLLPMNHTESKNTVNDLKQLLNEVNADTKLKNIEKTVLKGRLCARIGQNLLNFGQASDALNYLKVSRSCLEKEMENSEKSLLYKSNVNLKQQMNIWAMRLSEDISRCFTLQGKHVLAEKNWKECAERERREISKGIVDHISFGQCIEGMALAKQGQGKFTESESLFKSALKKYELAINGTNNSEPIHLAIYITCKIHLIENYLLRSQFSKAQKLLIEILESLEENKLKGFQKINEKISTSELLVLLGFCLQQQGLFDEAREAHIQAFNQVEMMGQKGKLSVHELLSAATIAYQRSPNNFNNSDLGVPENVLRSSLESERLKYCGDDPRLASALSNAAWGHFIAGKLNEAESLMREAMSLKRKDDPTIGDLQHRLGAILFTKGNFKEAEEILLETVQLFTRKDVMNLPLASNCMVLLSKCLLNGKSRAKDEAISTIQKALTLQESIYGKSSFQYMQALFTMGEANMRSNNFGEAENCFRDIISHWEHFVPPIAKNLHSHSKICLAGVLLSQDRDDEAIAILYDVLKNIGESHPEYIYTLSVCSSALLKVKREEEALQMATKALSLRMRDGKVVDAPECINLLLILAQINRSKDENEKAEKNVRESLCMAERIFGLQSPQTAKIMMFLSDCLKTEPGCLPEADELMRKAKKILSEIEPEDE